MIIVPLPLIWIGIGAAALLIARMVGWRLTRPLGWRHTRAMANRIAEAHTEPANLVQGTAAELQVEGMAGRWRRRSARAARLCVVAAHRKSQIIVLESRHDRLAKRQRELRQQSPSLSPSSRSGYRSRSMPHCSQVTCS